MDMTPSSGLKFAKPEPRIVKSKTRKQAVASDERTCRIEVRRRDKGRCTIPGCKESAQHMHHIVYRSHSKKRRWLPENNTSLCVAHHQLVHAGKIKLHRNADGELIATGARKDLEFKL